MPPLSLEYLDGGAAARSKVEMEDGGGIDVEATDGHRIGIGAIVSIGTILIDDGHIAAVSEENKRQIQISSLVIGHTADVPVVG